MAHDDASYLSQRGEETLLLIHVQPRAARSGFSGLFGRRLKIRISAAPVEGEANRECIAFLAAVLGVSKSEVRLLRGGQSRDKTFVISRPIAFVREKLKGADPGV